MPSNKILIVDDSQLILRAHAETVRQATDADLLLVCNGEDGIATLEEHPDTSLILLDLTMPGMDGLTFLETLHDYGPPLANIPVIIVSSSNDQDKLLAATKLGAKSYITKPLTLSEVLTAVKDLPQNEPVAEKKTEGKQRILLVEDSALVRQWTSDALREAGYDVVEAEDMWVSNTVNRYKPDFILMDIGLGSANSGIIAAKSLKRSIAANIPLYFYSSQPLEAIRDAVEDSDADGFIQKSDDSTTLLATIREALG